MLAVRAELHTYSVFVRNAPECQILQKQQTNGGWIPNSPMMQFDCPGDLESPKICDLVYFMTETTVFNY